MVSKNQKKLINSLHQKKYRKQHGMFVAEGKKVIQELLSAGVELHALYTTEAEIFGNIVAAEYVVTHEELKKISFLSTPQVAVALFKIPKPKEVQSDGLILALDDVRDPGNLGTIIRLCDWFGVQNLICSTQTVDCYNPKVVQATMGSISRVHIKYLNLEEFLTSTSKETCIYGTFMLGDSIYEKTLPKKDVIVVMGNEANGISDRIQKCIHKKITIPRFGLVQKTESLNVATATAIVLNEFKRP